MGSVLLIWYVVTVEATLQDKISNKVKFEDLNDEEDNKGTSKNNEKRRQSEIKIHQNSKILTDQQCERLTLQQLDELDHNKYEMSETYKEMVMDYRDNHSVRSVIGKG